MRRPLAWRLDREIRDIMAGPTPAARSDARILWLIFATLSLAWGSSFLFIKIGLDEGLTPLSLVSFRLWIASAFVAVVLKLTHGRLPQSRAVLGRLMLLGLINIVIPFSLITWGELYIPSALASILNGLVPLFTIVLAALVLHDEPMTANRLVGLLVGFAGAVLLLAPRLGTASGPIDPTMALMGELAVAVASLSYAFAAIFMRRSITGRPLVNDPVRGPRPLTPVEVVLPQCVTAAIVTSGLAIVFERPSGLIVPPTLPAWFAVGWLGLIGSGIAFLLFFRLITSWGATRATLVTYVMPIVGIALGFLILNERLDVIELVGAALVIGGLVLANSKVGQRRLMGRAGTPAK